jgi:hypothetical protein
VQEPFKFCFCFWLDEFEEGGPTGKFQNVDIFFLKAESATHLIPLSTADSQPEDLLWMHTAQVPVDSICSYGAELSQQGN